MVDSWSEPRLRQGGVGFFTRAAREAACAGCRSRISTTCWGACARTWRLTTFHRQTGAGNHERTEERNRSGAARATGKAVSPALARSVSLHLEGKRKEALRELNTAIENGEEYAGNVRRQGPHPVRAGAVRRRHQDLREAARRWRRATPRRTSTWASATRSWAAGRKPPTPSRRRSEVDPQREEAQLGLGICLLHQEKPEPAIACFDKVLARQPDHETALFGKAVSLQLLWKFDEATALYLKILEKNPQSEECLVNLITIGMARKDHAAIQQYSERLLTHASVFAGRARRSGDLRVPHRTITKPPRAIAPSWWSSRPIISSAGSTWAWRSRSADAWRRPPRPIRRSGAHPSRRQAGAREPGHRAAGTGRAEAGARESYERALQIAPDLADVIYNLASVLEQQGEKEDAERLYVKLLSAQSGMGRRVVPAGLSAPAARRSSRRGGGVPGLRAQARAVAGGAAEPGPGATGTWAITTARPRRSKRVLEADPHSIDALRGLAALAVEREDLDKALDLQAKLIEAGERTPELFYNTGLLLQKSGQMEDAIRLYQEALTERPNFAEALLNLGHALKAQGKVDEARNYWRQALEQKPELATGYFEQ